MLVLIALFLFKHCIFILVRNIQFLLNIWIKMEGIISSQNGVATVHYLDNKDFEVQDLKLVVQ